MSSMSIKMLLESKHYDGKVIRIHELRKKYCGLLWKSTTSSNMSPSRGIFLLHTSASLFSSGNINDIVVQEDWKKTKLKYDHFVELVPYWDVESGVPHDVRHIFDCIFIYKEIFENPSNRSGQETCLYCSRTSTSRKAKVEYSINKRLHSINYELESMSTGVDFQ